jgi:hypothetical protein
MGYGVPSYKNDQFLLFFSVFTISTTGFEPVSEGTKCPSVITS